MLLLSIYFQTKFSITQLYYENFFSVKQYISIFVKRGRSPMKLNDLLSVLPVYEIEDTLTNPDINNITMDHRNVTEGDLFVCIQGFTVDGHDFAEKAVERGALVIVSERPLAIEGSHNVIVPD